MANTRFIIKKYLRELIKRRETLAGDNIFFNRPVNYDLSVKDAEVRIMSLNSRSEMRAKAPRIYKEMYYASVEIAYVPDTDDYEGSEEDFEEMIAEIQDAIETHQHLDNPEILTAIGNPDFCVEDTWIDSIRYRTEPDGARPIYLATLDYEVCYNREAGGNVDDLEDLEELASEMTPVPATAGTDPVESVVEF